MKLKFIILFLMTASFCYAQDSLKLLSDSEIQTMRKQIQTFIEQGNIQKDYLQTWENDIQELSQILTLPIFTKILKPQGKTKDDILGVAYTAIQRMKKIEVSDRCLIDYKGGDSNWGVFTVSKMGSGYGDSCYLAIKFFANDGLLKIAAWETTKYPHAYTSKELMNSLVSNIEFALE